jgi:hypothetical protein
LKAYRNTLYQTGDISVRIGRRCHAMDKLLCQHRVSKAAFITAYNPHSRPMPPGWNKNMQQRLHQALRQYRIRLGTGSWRRWSEVHFLVLGDPRPVQKLARRFRQNGIVIIRLRQPPQLLITS